MSQVRNYCFPRFLFVVQFTIQIIINFILIAFFFSYNVTSPTQQKNDVTERMVYMMFCMRRNFVSGLLCILTSDKAKVFFPKT